MSFSHKHQVMLTISIIAVLFTIILLMIVPTIRGHNVIKDLKKYGLDVNEVINSLEKMNQEKEISKVKLDTCNNINKELESQIKTFSSDLVKSQQEIVKIERDYELKLIELNNNITNLKKEHNDQLLIYIDENDKLKNELLEIEENLILIIQNAANNLCCKYKVDYPQTDSYIISKNKIVCTNGETDKISCN
jgi:hypothetical protein